MSKQELLQMVRNELDYLRWFFVNADFGPADGDVRDYLNEQYVEETGNEIPEGY